MASEGRKSPKQIIEDVSSAKKEQSFVKYPRENLNDTTLISSPNWVLSNFIRRNLFWKRHNKRPYTSLHTHPKESGYYSGGIPSPLDLRGFLVSGKKVKTTIVAQQDPETKKVLGYTILRKTKKTPQLTYKDPVELNKKAGKRKYYDTQELKGDVEKHDCEMYYHATNSLLEFATKYNLNVKFISTKGYKIDRMDGTFVPIIKKRGLEEKVLVLGLVFLFSILFITSGITGFAVTRITAKTSNLIGVGLFIIGIISCYCYSRKK